jgi:EAL domain-containing protein (putative c-di-GMP-specific phosphodiesterase class I)/ActR/RegA family two-component response regulator
MDEPKGTILLVDDDPSVLAVHARVLARGGFAVELATDGQSALDTLGRVAVDAVVSDVTMPRMSGIDLLRGVRERDLDLPVILLTGQPSLDTAILAVQNGALRYLLKPVAPDTLVKETNNAVRLYQWAKLRREANGLLGVGEPQAGDQPIVSWSGKATVGYEALMRSSEESLPLPGAVLRAAERLGRCDEVGRGVRGIVATALASSPGVEMVFVNLHVRELLDDSLYDADAPLSRHARRVVLALTERASLDEVVDVVDRVRRLRAMGYRIAIDHLGAGYSSLTTFAQLEPEVVKLDMSLCREVHQHPFKQKLVGSFVLLARDMGLQLVAEGVESAEEHGALVALGCDLLQGYRFARPRSSFVDVVWP